MSSWVSPSREMRSEPIGASRDDLVRDEPVVDEHLARAHAREPAHRDQLGIARARADERHGHDSAFATRSRK